MSRIVGFLTGWQGMALGAALIAAFAFGTGWTINGWRHDATQLAKANKALSETLARVESVATALEAGNAEQERIRQETSLSARKVRDYVEANNSCRFTADDRRVFIESRPGYQNPDTAPVQ